MSESDTRRSFCQLIASLDPVPIENLLTGNTGTGTPDVEFIGGWMELKNFNKWPSREYTPVRISHYTDEQRAWMMRRWNKGGWAGLCLQVKQEWFVWSAPNAQEVGHLPRLEMISTADMYFKTKPSPEVFTEGLKALLTNHPLSR